MTQGHDSQPGDPDRKVVYVLRQPGPVAHQDQLNVKQALLFVWLPRWRIAASPFVISLLAVVYAMPATEWYKRLFDFLRQDVNVLALQSSQSNAETATQATESRSIGQSLLKDLQSTQPVGRLVVILDRALAAAPGFANDLLLRAGDTLRVPRRPQEATVIGGVQNMTCHLYDPSLSRDDCLRMSGGPTRKADTNNVYVVCADGSVGAGTGNSRFRSSRGPMQPGGTIAVPIDAERIRPLQMWTEVTTISYNLAVAVAAMWRI